MKKSWEVYAHLFEYLSGRALTNHSAFYLYVYQSLLRYLYTVVYSVTGIVLERRSWCVVAWRNGSCRTFLLSRMGIKRRPFIHALYQVRDPSLQRNNGGEVSSAKIVLRIIAASRSVWTLLLQNCLRIITTLYNVYPSWKSLLALLWMNGNPH